MQCRGQRPMLSWSTECGECPHWWQVVERRLNLKGSGEPDSFSCRVPSQFPGDIDAACLSVQTGLLRTAAVKLRYCGAVMLWGCDAAVL